MHILRISFVLLFCAAPLASAATLSGRVLDSTNAPLPGVTVEASSHVTVTDAEGRYTLDVPSGAYDVTFRLLNFAATARRGVEITTEARVDVTLYLSVSADVVVTAKRTFRDLSDIDDGEDLLGIADAATVGVVTAKEIARRPFQRAGEILETVPGVVVSQHSGEGKANQYYLRGFNLDHGTDIAITVAGVPVNMPTHAHGQGYADANFLIPELISGVQYKKGPYYADEGDFASAGAINVNYLNLLERPVALAQVGTFGYRRALVAASPRIGSGFLLAALEATQNSGPWVQPDDYRRLNAVLRYSTGGQHGGFSITGMGYDARWSSTDQIPLRAVSSGELSRFGYVDPTDGGTSSRYSLAADWQLSGPARLTRVSAYAMKYRLDLFSNFTYFLDDPVNGDQFEQKDDRLVFGAEGSHRWLAGRMENVAGVQARRDAIDDVGLHHTVARRRLATIRQDDVLQTSIGAYVQSSTQWSPRLRTLAGLRADRYQFDVGRRSSASLVSPKLSVMLGPWRNTELYVNAGSGFHSNDARGGSDVTPLARTKGAELGLRSRSARGLHLTASLWGLDIASELVFVGDAGTSVAGRPSRRTGVELAATWNVRNWLALDGEYAYSRGRFRDRDPAGDRIPGAIEGVATLGLSLIDLGPLSAELRYRRFGPRPLIEDDSVRSTGSNLVSARAGWALTPHLRLDVDVFNLLDAEVSDVDYFYTSRLRDEAVAVDDVHFHPVEKRSVRIGVSTTF
ncbi:MAG TPA: TonB-dependent receptor [Thermoanaerobaculia bacterium]|nr:TonB-dependent receptor [Thermoanaerobaculia bacterium]